MAKNFKKILVCVATMLMIVSVLTVSAFATLGLTASEGWTWDEENKTLTLNNANITEKVTLPAGSKIVVKGNNTIAVEGADAITCEGELTISGEGSLKLTGSNGIMATAASLLISAEPLAVSR